MYPSLSYNFKKSQNLLNQTFNNDITEFNSRFFGAHINYHSFHKNQFNIELQTSFGSRKIPLEKIPQYSLVFKTSILIGLNKNLQLFMKNSTGYLNSKKYLQNELFRIGGPNSIRGFDQQSIFTSAYSFINSELRYSTLVNSTIYTVFDFGTIKDLNSNKKLYSIGLGYVFKTNYNLLDISYIANKSTEIPFNFNNSKITVKLLTFF